MTQAAWPAGLPQQPAVRGLSAAPADVRLRTPMDVGPAKVRLTSTVKTHRWIMTMVGLTPTQAALLLAFWKTSCKAGELAFEWRDASTGDVAEFKFLVAPSLTPRGPRSASSTKWTARFELEQLPRRPELLPALFIPPPGPGAAVPARTSIASPMIGWWDIRGANDAGVERGGIPYGEGHTVSEDFYAGPDKPAVGHMVEVVWRTCALEAISRGGFADATDPGFAAMLDQVLVEWLSPRVPVWVRNAFDVQRPNGGKVVPDGPDASGRPRLIVHDIEEDRFVWVPETIQPRASYSLDQVNFVTMIGADFPELISGLTTPQKEALYQAEFNRAARKIAEHFAAASRQLRPNHRHAWYQCVRNYGIFWHDYSYDASKVPLIQALHNANGWWFALWDLVTFNGYVADVEHPGDTHPTVWDAAAAEARRVAAANGRRSCVLLQAYREGGDTVTDAAIEHVVKATLEDHYADTFYVFGYTGSDLNNATVIAGYSTEMRRWHKRIRREVLQGAILQPTPELAEISAQDLGDAAAAIGAPPILIVETQPHSAVTSDVVFEEPPATPAFVPSTFSGKGEEASADTGADAGPAADPEQSIPGHLSEQQVPHPETGTAGGEA